MRYLGLVVGTLLTLAGARVLAVALTRTVSPGSTGDGGELALMFLAAFGAIVVGVTALARGAHGLATARGGSPEDMTIARFTSAAPEITRMTAPSPQVSSFMTIDASGGHAKHAGHAGQPGSAAVEVQLPTFVGQFLPTFDPQASAGLEKPTSGSATVFTFDLTVRLPGRDAYTVQRAANVPRAGVTRLAPGSSVPVRVDPLAANEVLIEWARS